ncbi:GDP-mannose-dependent alpha-mannosyltransferase [Usitatibacter rugosus]|uniref:GDP-mannose-dependent alpha-mannosyltransferase n=1 Tax=Usitatibacter rugosus TaxID=2732067 RepID=A0A6M4H071_9PROT|nr:glycosyltransferase family 1 protein [Usitatibacter rugosus]QJR12063.1 GDP-mannose-dependent alpha-mannosyltransferase [Usitatibacter rugosus]
MRILIATDAWAPQINGVVVTLVNIIARLRKHGHEVHVISPEGFFTLPMPTYPEIPLAVMPGRGVSRQIREFDPDTIHIATEGPIGAAARRYCLRRGLAFTSAYHTCFPEYVQPRFGVPLAWGYAFMRRFHAPSSAVMVATPAMRRSLEEHGFERIVDYKLGTDLELFHPTNERFTDLPRPVFTYVGRVALEKNLPAFLELDLPGSKLVVGDGPARKKLEREFPNARFVGFRHGVELASYYQRSDAFVFPSLTDTFGLVMLEALACGVPVAAFPVRGPIDVVKDARVGVLDQDLRRAALAALELDRAGCRRYAEAFPWEETTRQFLAHMAPARLAQRDPLGAEAR